MAQPSPAHLAPVIEFLSVDRKGVDVSLEDVMQLAELMAESLQGFLVSIDTTVYAELGDMAREIAAMKSDLSKLQFADMRYERIPDAGRELDAIVEATETATNTIMTAAEDIMGADPSDAEAYQVLVSDRIVEIFEACSFQDITGQRISKVVTTLAHIEKRIATLVDRLKPLRLDEAPPMPETDEERRRRELILHGPQHKGEGVSQDDIDALLR